MSGPDPRDRAEAAFGHVRHAASEMIAAARDALDLLDDVVTSAELGQILTGFDHLSRSVFSWRPSAGAAAPDPSPTPSSTATPAPAPDSRPHGGGPVEHISVR